MQGAGEVLRWWADWQWAACVSQARVSSSLKAVVRSCLELTRIVYVRVLSLAKCVALILVLCSFISMYKKSAYTNISRGVVCNASRYSWHIQLAEHVCVFCAVVMLFIEHTCSYILFSVSWITFLNLLCRKFNLTVKKRVEDYFKENNIVSHCDCLISIF